MPVTCNARASFVRGGLDRAIKRPKAHRSVAIAPLRVGGAQNQAERFVRPEPADRTRRAMTDALQIEINRHVRRCAKRPCSSRQPVKPFFEHRPFHRHSFEPKSFGAQHRGARRECKYAAAVPQGVPHLLSAETDAADATIEITLSREHHVVNGHVGWIVLGDHTGPVRQLREERAQKPSLLFSIALVRDAVIRKDIRRRHR